MIDTEKYIGGQRQYAKSETHLTNDKAHQWAIQNELGRLPGCNTFLDVGCNDGWAMRKAWEIRGCSVYGVTYNQTEKEYAAPDMYDKIIVGDFHNLSGLVSGKFDVVWARHVLEHALSPYVVLYESNLVMNLGGLLFVILPQITDTGDCHYLVPTDNQMLVMFKKLKFKLVEQWDFDTDRGFTAMKVGELP